MKKHAEEKAIEALFYVANTLKLGEHQNYGVSASHCAPVQEGRCIVL
jgi:hypothetical protein